MARKTPAPQEATNDAVRRLRELVRRNGYARIAKLVGTDESTIRRYARELRRPHGQMKMLMRSALGILEDAWDAAPYSDVYATDPATVKKAMAPPAETEQPATTKRA